MSTVDVALDFAALCSMIVTAVLIVVTLAGGYLRERVFRWFLTLLVMSLIAMAAELGVVHFAENIELETRTALRVLGFIDCAVSGVCMAVFGQYLCAFLSLKAQVSKRFTDLCNWLAVAAVLLAAFEPFTDAFYWLDQNGQHYRGPLYALMYLLPATGLFTATTFILRYRRALSAKELFTLLMYPVAPTICYVIELRFEGVWVTAIGATFTLLLIYVSIQMDLQKKLAKQEAELTDSRIAIMLSQIQPHFLYSALGTIDNLIYTDPQSAHDALYSFSGYLRGNMDSLAQKELIPLAQELQHTQQYLSLEKLRYRHKLEIVFDIQCDKFMMPVLTLQPIVENAVRYGVMRKPGGGTVTIRAEDAGQCYRVTVHDDGVGFDPDHPAPSDAPDGRSHVGIANVRDRLKAMCGGRLTIESAPGVGTTAIIEIPKG